MDVTPSTDGPRAVERDLDDRLMTAQEVAAALRVPASWVYSAARRGDLAPLRLGRYVRFRRDQIESLIDGR